MDQKIADMEKAGIIGKCNYSKWNSACFLVPKKGNRWRYVSDQRGVNKNTEDDNFELPKIGNILDQISETKYMSFGTTTMPPSSTL